VTNSKTASEGKQLSLFGEALLLVLNNAKVEVSTKEIFEALAGKYEPLSLSSIFITLDRMSKKGLVAVRKGDPIPQRGGKALLYYKITNAGQETIRKAQHLRDMLNSGAKRPPRRSTHQALTPRR
jgi:DNA-binding PadR family transcriptional regulator